MTSVYIRALALCVVVLAGLSGCRRVDARTMKIDVPAMRSVECAHIVGQAVSALKGVHPELTVIDLNDRTVTVTYDSIRIALKNIEFAIADAGFQANDVPPDKERQKSLPEECRDGN